MKYRHQDDSPRKRSAPQSMADLMPRLMAQRGYGRLLSHDEFAEAWEQVAGNLGSQSRVGQLRRGVLEVFVANSLVLQEMTFQKRKLLKAMMDQLPDHKIRDLKLSVGSWS